jgi:hypothetical protein
MFQVYLLNKIAFFQFLNVGVFIILIPIIIDYPQLDYLTKEAAAQIFKFLAIHSFVDNILNFIIQKFKLNPEKMYRKFMFKRKYDFFSQHDLNLIYEG